MSTIKNFNEKYYLNAKSPAFKQMLHLCEKVAKTNVNVLLIGESGSGKEIAARYIHELSSRSKNQMITINCSSYTENLLESELFGHAEGSFTGAIREKIGKIETADNSTLFLDEIGDLSLVTQVKLLRTIENRKIQKVGTNKEKDVNFRMITATNIVFEDAINSGRIREDFFYRISTIVIKVPPLRERREDFDDMLYYFLSISEAEHDIKINSIEPVVKEFLYNYNYPGNIRELKNILDRMVVLSENGVITEQGLPLLYSMSIHNQQSSNLKFEKVIPLKEFKKNQEKAYLKWILKKFNYNVEKSAKSIEISSRQLFNKISEYNLKE